MNKRALIFGGVIVGAVAIIAVGVWFMSLFGPEPGGNGQKQDLFSSLFPFGFGGGTRAGLDENPGGDGSENASGPAPHLREVSRDPVAGAYATENGLLYYVERGSGHIFQTPLGALDVTRLSNTTIPGVERVTWLSDGSAILQFYDQAGMLKNYLAVFSTTTADQAVSGRYLGEFSYALPTVNSGEAILVSVTTAGIRAELAGVSGGQSKTVFSSPLSAWTVFESSGGLFVETAPSSQPGFLYRVGANQSLEKIVGGFPGLMTVINEAGTWAAVSSTGENETALYAYDMTNARTFSSFIATLAEKCAWFRGESPMLFCGVPSSLENVSIENWYMGLSSFSDTAWIIDPVSGVARVVSNLEEAGRPIDIIEPSVSPDGKYVIFTNKNDLSLWSLRLD